MTIGPKDPLGNAIKPAQRELYERMAKVAHGFVAEDVIGACINMMANALRQSHANRDRAIAEMDHLFAQARTIVAAQYALTGKRLNGVFPFDQTLKVDHIDFSKNIKW